MKIRFKTHFDAAHKLCGYQGDCANLHGHRWEVISEFEVLKTNEVGIAADFKSLKKMINEVLPDHQFLNDIPEIIAKQNPTAENLALVIARRIITALAKDVALSKFVGLSSLELFESPGCSVFVTIEDLSL